jgi:Na+/phosphate symporter
MTTSSECFWKQVKSSVCTVFNTFIIGAVFFLPLIIFFIWFFVTHSAMPEFEKTNLLFVYGMFMAIVNAIYIIIFGFPFIRCYYRVDI